MKQMNKLNQNFTIDILLAVTGFLLSLSGILLQVKYHAGRLPKNVEALFFDYYSWSLFHKVFSVIFFMLVSCHIYLHKEWYLRHFITKTAKQRKSPIPTILFFITALTGFIPWLLGYFNTSPNGYGLWRGLIEIHDKLGIVLIILMLIHLKSKFNWIKAMVIKVLGLKKVNSQIVEEK